MTALRPAIRRALRPALRSAIGTPLLKDIQLLLAANDGALYINDISTMYQDAAGTTPVTAVDDPVGRWEDQSGNGNHATQSTAAARPLLKQDAGGRYYLQFDGVDDYFNLYTGDLPASFVQFVAYDTDGEAAGIFINDSSGSAPWSNIFQSGSTSTVLGNGFVFNELLVDGDEVVIVDRDDAYQAINGNHVSIFDSTPSGGGGDWAMGNFSVPYSLSGRMYAHGWIDGSGLSATDKQLITAYLASLSGVTT